MISYAGVDLSYHEGVIDQWVSEVLPAKDLPVLWPGHNLEHLGFLDPFEKPHPQLGRLYWPRGAAQFSVGWYLVTESELNAIRQRVYQSSLRRLGEKLIITDGTNKIEPRMFPLVPRPLSIGGHAGWIFTLVDDRYYWWFRRGELTVSPGVTTWNQLFTQIGNLLNVDITVSSIPAAYMTPSQSLGESYYRATPLLLDAVSASVGQRIVRHFDGTVLSLNIDNAKYYRRRNQHADYPIFEGGYYSL